MDRGRGGRGRRSNPHDDGSLPNGMKEMDDGRAVAARAKLTAIFWLFLPRHRVHVPAPAPVPVGTAATSR